MGRRLIEVVEVLVDQVHKAGYQHRVLEDSIYEQSQKRIAAEKDRDHWKQARQEAIEAGELMRAEIETLRQENGTLRKDFVTLQWIVEHMKKMAGGVSTRDADGCILAVGQIQKYFDAAEYPLCNPQQKGGE